MDYKTGQKVYFIDIDCMYNYWHSFCVKRGTIIMDTSMSIDTIEDDDGNWYDVKNSDVFLDYESAVAEFRRKHDGHKHICAMSDEEWSIFEIEKVLNRWKKCHDVSVSLYDEVKQWLLSDPHVEDLEVRICNNAIQYRYDPCVVGCHPDTLKTYIESKKSKEAEDLLLSNPNCKYYPPRCPFDKNCTGWKNGWQTVPMCQEYIREEYHFPPKNCIHRWDQNTFEQYEKTRGILHHIQGVEAYIYQMNGNYTIHRYYTPIGLTVYIADDGKILCGDVDIKKSGKMYNVHLTNMYGRLSLEIIHIGAYVYGWSNKDADSGRTISTQCKELSRDVVEKVLNDRECRFDDVSTRFMNFLESIYESDKSNYFCI